MNCDRFKFRVWDRGSYSTETHVLTQGGKAIIVTKVKGLPAFFCVHEQAIVEQCTGQSDQSGRLIFENDVVEVYDLLTDCWNRCIVRWTDECGGWICAYAEPEQVVHGCSLASPSGTCLDGALCRLVSHEEGVRNENQG